MQNPLRLQGNVTRRPQIELHAVYGEFRIHGSPFVIRYASTFANPHQEGGHSELLRELLPVRDRVSPRALQDLGSLLQRDLNDERVARELIPYLQGERGRVGFFPAVLAVLVPKGYLEAPAGGIAYPTGETTEQEGLQRVQYGDCWSVEQWRLDGQLLPMGILRVAPSQAEIIVLDGQHRSTAFRYMSGDFAPADTIYGAFYQQANPPRMLRADLPVTLIWFDPVDEEPVEPKVISRQLFVDVNNSAKPVSNARTILLDDRGVTSVGVQELYNVAASRNYVTEQFSLLHSAFDIDSDLGGGGMSPFALTTPEIIDDVLAWTFFGSTAYDDLSTWSVQRLRGMRNRSRFAAQFGDLFPLAEDPDEDTRRFLFTSNGVAREFRSAFDELYRPVLLHLLDEFALLRPHYRACASVETWITDEADTAPREVWEEVFTGGQGLYASFKQVKAPAGRSATYQQALTSIEQRFAEERAEAFGAPPREVDRIYIAFVTKAFQVGYAMAVDFLAQRGVGEGRRVAASEQLLERLNSYSTERWRSFFLEFKPLVFTSTTPRDWPAYRNMLLRMYDGDRREHFDVGRVEEYPDWRAYERMLLERANAIANSQDEFPSEGEIRRHAETRLTELKRVAERCGLGGSFPTETLLERGINLLRRELEGLFGSEETE